MQLTAPEDRQVPETTAVFNGLIMSEKSLAASKCPDFTALGDVQNLCARSSEESSGLSKLKVEI